jgi:uncharacterized damage-inducible protein DinB
MDKAIELLTQLTEAEFDEQSFNGLPLMETLRKLTLDQVTTKDTYEGYTVWGIVLHLIYWKYFLGKQLGGTGGFDSFPYEEKDWPPLPEELSKSSWEKTLQELESAHRSYIEALKRFPSDRLEEEIKEWRCSCGKACAWMSTHDTYHTAQIRNMGLK